MDLESWIIQIFKKQQPAVIDDNEIIVIEPALRPRFLKNKPIIHHLESPEAVHDYRLATEVMLLAKMLAEDWLRNRYDALIRPHTVLPEMRLFIMRDLLRIAPLPAATRTSLRLLLISLRFRGT